MPRDIILTGIPRSGTTLAATLLDSMSDTVCLHEPLWQTKKFPSGEAFSQFVLEDFSHLRKKLLAEEPVENRQATSHEALTNYYRRVGGRMEYNFAHAPFVRPGLGKNFTLAVKHNGPYLAILDALAARNHFIIIAIVRNPVEVIHSWRTLDLPVSRGEMPGAVPYWPQLAEIIRKTPDILERQVKMYDVMCGRIIDMKDHIHVLTYEALIADPTQLIRAAGLPGNPPASLIDKPQRHIAQEERTRIVNVLEKHGKHFRQFYPELN